jgi:hypothetical protein
MIDYFVQNNVQPTTTPANVNAQQSVANVNLQSRHSVSGSQTAMQTNTSVDAPVVNEVPSPANLIPQIIAAISGQMNTTNNQSTAAQNTTSANTSHNQSQAATAAVPIGVSTGPHQQPPSERNNNQPAVGTDTTAQNVITAIFGALPQIISMATGQSTSTIINNSASATQPLVQQAPFQSNSNTTTRPFGQGQSTDSNTNTANSSTRTSGDRTPQPLYRRTASTSTQLVGELAVAEDSMETIHRRAGDYFAACLRRCVNDDASR